MGIATATKIAMIATAINNSINVNPFFCSSAYHLFPVVTYQRAKRVMMLIHDDNQSNKFQ